MARKDDLSKILPNNELEKKIIEAFEVFDHSGKQTVDVREIGTILRSLGCCPTEAEIQELILATESKEATGSIPLPSFLPFMCKAMTEHRYYPASADELLAAFRYFDKDGKGYLSKEQFTKLMLEEGENFTQEEFDEMMQTALDPVTDTITYEYYINQLMIKFEDLPSRAGTSALPLIRALEIQRTPQGSLIVGNHKVLLERTESGQVRPWCPESVQVGEGIEYVERPQITPRRLSYGDNDENDDEIFDDGLAEALTVDSSSEEEQEDFTEQQLLELLQDPEDAESDVPDAPSESFNWSEDFSTFTGRREQFLEEVGPRIEGSTPSEIFCQLWDQPLIEMMVAQTNLYA